MTEGVYEFPTQPETSANDRLIALLDRMDAEDSAPAEPAE